MLTTRRKQQILSILKRNGQVIAKEVSQSMGVSEDTIRRDLRELAQEGLLQRVHGGALPASPAVANFAGRELITAEGKVAIGRAAARMIRTGQVVILDGGTTARQVVRHLPLDLKATIVTHSPTIALELVNHADIEVILIGGRMFKHSLVAVGAAAIEAISLTLLFVVVTFVDTGAGAASLASRVSSFVSVPLHFRQDFTRGVLDSRHLILYGSVTLFCLFMTVRSIESRRWR